VNVDLIQTNDEIKARFQEVHKFKNGSNMEIPVIIDDHSTEMLEKIDPIVIDAFGWSYFKKLGIKNRPVRYIGGSC